MEGEMHNAEIPRLMNENRRLLQRQNILQYELDVAKEELYDKNLMITNIRVEHEIHCRKLMKRGLKLIEEIPAVETLKNEVKHLHSEVTRLCNDKHDLSNQVETLTKELVRLHAENKQIPSLRVEIDRLHHQLLCARSAVKYEPAEVQSIKQKICAFCSMILQQVKCVLVHCQVLILASTCERAHQIEEAMRAHCGHFGIKIYACVDGNSIEEDKYMLSSGVHFVVGTPWRVSDLLCTQNQSLHLDHIKIFVLDEADEMLSRGFDVQIHKILSLLPAKVEVIALYATMPKDILDITRKLMNNSERMNLWQSIVFL